MEVQQSAFLKTRVLTLSYSDPDATDDSGDDYPGGGGTLGGQPKKVTHKITLQIHLHNQQNKSVSMSRQLTRSAPANNINNRKAAKNVIKVTGTHPRASGRFSAEIRDPLIKKRVWLGTFDTQEEAAAAYLSRRHQIDSRRRGRRTRRCVPQAGAPSYSAGSRELSGDATAAAVGESRMVDDGGDSGFGFLNGVQVLDKNGFFMGEFSKIDDLSICWGESGEEDQVFLP